MFCRMCPNIGCMDLLQSIVLSSDNVKLQLGMSLIYTAKCKKT